MIVISIIRLVFAVTMFGANAYGVAYRIEEGDFLIAGVGACIMLVTITMLYPPQGK